MSSSAPTGRANRTARRDRTPSAALQAAHRRKSNPSFPGHCPGLREDGPLGLRVLRSGPHRVQASSRSTDTVVPGSMVPYGGLLATASRNQIIEDGLHSLGLPLGSMITPHLSHDHTSRAAAAISRRTERGREFAGCLSLKEPFAAPVDAAESANPSTATAVIRYQVDFVFIISSSVIDHLAKKGEGP